MYKKEKRIISKTKVADTVLSLLYPPTCPFCGKLERRGICTSCQERIIYIEEPRCKKCGKPVRKEEQEYCLDCQSTNHAFEDGRNLWLHKPPVSQAIYAFKYQNRKIYGHIFGKEMAERYAEYIAVRQINLILPIPLHKKREKKRGYNQSAILAEKISEYTGIKTEKNILLRVKETVPQKELNDKQRRKNIQGAFSVKKGVTLPANLLLIDDIYTTGSTLNEAARILQRAGAQKVYFLTISIGQGF